MIRTAFTGGSGQRIVVLGLSDTAIQQLKRNRSIKVDLEDLGVQGQVILVWGPTDKAILEKLERNGVKVPS